MTDKEESEFGKGLVVNLVKCAEHLDFGNRHLRRVFAVDRWIKGGMKDELTSDSVDIEHFKRVELKVRGEPKRALSDVIELWANGATDHLYDMKVPPSWKNKYVARQIRKLRDFGLTMGHGFTDTVWTVDDITKLRTLVRKISLKVDKELGIKDGDWGHW